MGHQRLAALAQTRRWVQVVCLIRGGAGAAQVATATATAAEAGLKKAANDPGVVEAVWLLTRLPYAARADDFADALRGLGLTVPDDPGQMDVVGAVTDAIDARLTATRGGRTDFGETALAAAAETISGVIGGRLVGLFESGPAEVRTEFARLATVKQFGIVAREFFSRFVYRTLDSFLSRTLGEQVGAGERFRTLARQAEFSQALELHCRQTAVIVERYAGEWLSKHQFQTSGDVTRELVAAFTAYGMTKLTAELRRRATPDAA
jgi:hypothetical protein